MPALQVAHSEGQHAEWDSGAVRGGGVCLQTQIRALLQTTPHLAVVPRHSLRDTPRCGNLLRGLWLRLTPQHCISTQMLDRHDGYHVLSIRLNRTEGYFWRSAFMKTRQAFRTNTSLSLIFSLSLSSQLFTHRSICLFDSDFKLSLPRI